MHPSALNEEIAAKYARFARNEARGRSPLYEELALGVAKDELVLRFLAELPSAKRQPNLLFASVRKACGTPTGWADFHECVASMREEIRAVMLTHSTQTNEPARCAALLPLLALLPQPLALLEVGAAAGLCFFPIIMHTALMRPRLNQVDLAISRRRVSIAQPILQRPFREQTLKWCGAWGWILSR